MEQQQQQLALAEAPSDGVSISAGAAGIPVEQQQGVDAAAHSIRQRPVGVDPAVATDTEQAPLVPIPVSEARRKQQGQVGKARLTLPPGLQHLYITVSSSSLKLDRLHRCINALGVERALVFVGSQRVAMFVRQRLMAKRMQVRRLDM